MTSKFEGVILGAASCLVLGSLSVAIIYPPSSNITVPRAKMRILEAGITRAAGGSNWSARVFKARSIVDGAGSLNERKEVEVLNSRNRPVGKHTVETLSKTFDRIGYNLNGVKSGGIGVPRLFLASLPPDLSEIRQTSKRKKIFFKTVLPLILQANDEIRLERRHLLGLHALDNKGKPLPAKDRLWLIVLAERYKLKQPSIEKLLKRVDIVPVSLALAQAAEESGWGTSRFSLEGNAIFGEWTFSQSNGLVPLHRGVGKFHRVRAFNSLLDSVRAYALNLNTHNAYGKFRLLRQEIRESGLQIRGRQLIDTLGSYSERGTDYLKGIRAIIGANKLDPLDDAKLSKTQIEVRPLI